LLINIILDIQILGKRVNHVISFCLMAPYILIVMVPFFIANTITNESSKKIITFEKT